MTLEDGWLRDREWKANRPRLPGIKPKIGMWVTWDNRLYAGRISRVERNKIWVDNDWIVLTKDADVVAVELDWAAEKSTIVRLDKGHYRVIGYIVW